MEQIQPFPDERLLSRCVHCGGVTATRDHVPSKVLLDEEYPKNLPVVPSCDPCNQGFSLHEEYVAALIDCAIAGSTEAARVSRPRIRSTLEKTPALAARLEAARVSNSRGIAFHIEADRVRQVMLKLARGHAAYELSEPQLDEPNTYGLAAFELLSVEEREWFEAPPHTNLFPEVGSRAMQRIFEEPVGQRKGWVIVQEARYRYLATVDSTITVRMVLSEYLACEATWSSGS